MFNLPLDTLLYVLKRGCLKITKVKDRVQEDEVTSQVTSKSLGWLPSVGCSLHAGKNSRAIVT